MTVRLAWILLLLGLAWTGLAWIVEPTIPTPSRHGRDCLLPRGNTRTRVGGLAGPGRQRVAALAARWRSFAR